MHQSDNNVSILNNFKIENQSRIIKEIFEDLKKNNLFENQKIQDYLITEHSIWIKTSKWGMANIPLPDIKNIQIDIKNKNCLETAQKIFSSDIVESAIGLATINSVIRLTRKNLVYANGFDLLKEKVINKNVVMIGHFHKKNKIESLAKNLWILELFPQESDYPSSYSHEIIPQGDVIIITGTTFVNHTIDKILSHANSKAYIAIIGPTTPLVPILFDYNIKLLCGIEVSDEKKMIEGLKKNLPVKKLEGINFLCLTK